MTEQELRDAKRDIVAELTNAYFETYRYDRPNDTVDQLGAFCRDLAENDVDELLRQQQLALLQRVEEQAFSGFTHFDCPCVSVEVIQKMKEEL